MREVHEVHEVPTESGGGVASGMVVGIVLVLLVLALAAFMYFGGAFRSTTGPASGPSQPSGGQTNIQVNPPSNPAPKVEVNPPAPQAPAPQAPSNQGPSQPAPSKP